MKFESIEREHSDTLRKVNERICEVKQETGSGKSRISRRSSQVSHSRKSNGSSTASSLTKRTAIAANVARLKTELEFADAEAQKTRALKEHEDELKRFKLTKELAVAKAEMEALIKNEGDEIVTKESLPEEIDKNYVLQNYLKTQASSVTTVDNLTVETNVESVNEPLQESPSNNGVPVVKNEPVATLSKINPADETISLPKQDPAIPTPKSLNPFVSEFEASPFPRHDPYFTADYEPYKHQEAKISDSARKSTVEDPLTRLADILSQRRLQDSLPLPEPEIFSGDLLHYPVWLKSFQTIIEGQTEKVSQRLYYLGKYTTGEPKEAIGGLLLLETEDAYKRARKILSDRFGNPFLVADAYRKKINEWPKIPPNDGMGLREFSDFLIHCQTATNTVKYLKVLDDPDENQRMVRKLPRYLVDRWSREVDRWLNRDEDQPSSEITSSDVRKGEVDYPPFSVFCRFLQRESRVACNPVTTARLQKEEAVKEDLDKGRKSNGVNRRKPLRFNALATESHEVTDSNTNSRKERKSEPTSCPLCKAPHDLDVCEKFMKKSIAERRDFVKVNALCLGCLKWGHMKRICRRRLVCKTCNGFNPTSLHSDSSPVETEQSTSLRNTPEATSQRVNLADMKNANPSCMHSLIVPVWIHHRKDTKKKLLTYALLDEQSDACFVKEDLLGRLGVNGPEVELKLSTVLAEKVIKSRRIEGLVVRGYNEDVEIPLSKSYSRSSIPAKKSQIPRPESAVNWPHLRRISEKIMPLDEDVFMCDIQGMFHQVKVDVEHRNLLRFLWWDNPELKGDPVEFRMTVHLFGATSSPGCANFALKTTADQYEETCGRAAANFIRRNFYVDDGLKSVASVEQAKDLIKNTKSLCQKGGFRLHKFTSNSREVVSSVPEEDRATDAKDHRLISNDTAVERALGVHWCIESDTLQFRITMQDKAPTRRGILSTVSSVFDPLGLVAPFILGGKQILQELCRDGVGWDDEVPDKLRSEWEKWRAELPTLEKLRVARCHKPQDFDEVKNVELHHLSDACQNGYGQCSYIRLVDEKNRVHCCLVMGKSRVTPLKPVTIPRLELTAAVVSSKISCMPWKELDYARMKEVFWTDSKTVLGYINNDARRFHVFVGNRVQEIRERTSPNQWHYVGTKSNPADIASRGTGAQELVDNTLWWNGPDFLWNLPEDWNSVDDVPSITPEDPEVKKVFARATQIREPKLYSLQERLTYFSSWHRAKKAIAVCLRLQKRFQKIATSDSQSERKNAKKQEGIATYKPVDVRELKYAEQQIIKIVQNEAFRDEVQLLKDVKARQQAVDQDTSKDKIKTMKRLSSLYKLDPFLDEDGLLRVGGRLRQSSVPYEVKHPVILPKKGHVTNLVLCHYHKLVQHQGRGITQYEVRASGFWIIGGSSVVSNHISKCVSRRRLRGGPQEQKMANLPKDRLEPAPPFAFSAVDYFGPWSIKEGRREVKRYGVLFTCLASRAVHIEVASSLSTDSFLNAYRRFVGRRGPVQHLRSDQGTNFVGARNELQQELAMLEQDKIRQELVKRNCDWVDFKTNVPEASHMGGVWERQIRTVRNVLASLLTQHAAQLDDETLRTFMVEAENIVNCRPLTVDTINSSQLPEPLTPNHLLTMKSKVLFSPPGEFQRADLYSKKRWRRVQYLANEFWTRWRKDYLQSLQPRQKWIATRRNLQVDDIVVVIDDNLPRNCWRIARVEETYPDADGLVRKVRIKIADRNLDESGRPAGPLTSLRRPIQKLILLLPQEKREDQGIPT